MRAADIATRDFDMVLAEIAAAFGHALHARGIPVSPERSARFAECLNLASPTTSYQVYWVGRVTLLSAQAQIPIYDDAFNMYFNGEMSLSDLRSEVEIEPSSATPSVTEDSPDPGNEGSSSARTSPSGSALADDSGEPDDDTSIFAAASADEYLLERDFAACTDEELALIRQLVDRLPLSPPMRKARRERRHHRGTRLDIRATLRRAHRTGGEPIHFVRRRTMPTPRRVVLIADVSGSMEPYARIYLHLMRGAVRALGAECFVFSTRLTRLTRLLANDSVDTAYARVGRTATDWSGGTLIGTALSTFIDEHGRRGIARGAVVVVVSDGWDTGNPDDVGLAMSRLARMAHHIIWVNPRSSSVGFQPLVRGMAAAMPYVDTLVSGHSLGALQKVMDAVAAATERRQPSYV